MQYNVWESRTDLIVRERSLKGSVTIVTITNTKNIQTENKDQDEEDNFLPSRAQLNEHAAIWIVGLLSRPQLVLHQLLSLLRYRTRNRSNYLRYNKGRISLAQHQSMDQGKTITTTTATKCYFQL